MTHTAPPDPHLAETYESRATSALDKYRHEHAFSIQEMETFWGRKAVELLDWDKPFVSILSGSFEHGDVAWFGGGELNVCYNAVDRHVYEGKGDQVALLFEGDEPTDIRKITYAELMRKTSQIANALTSSGVRKGDIVTIYMPMIPELAMSMLACARIGAVHSVVFAGFSAEALSQRMDAAKSEYVITADHGLRAGKKVLLKDTVNEALTHHDCQATVKKVFVWERFFDPASVLEEKPAPYSMKPKDVRMDILVANQRPYAPCVSQDAEDNLFILYTSGSTGKPKGVVHTTGGYALYAALTHRTTFDLTLGDIYACVADSGWITGHSYVVYGPLINCATTFIFESTPVYPNPGRYWDMVQRHKITQFYTAPTAIRLLMKYGSQIPKQYDLSSLKVLGSVGEPINPEAWRWYYDHVGRRQCTIVDTYWQTETGGHIISNLPGVTPMKPGSCTLPLFGINPVVLDAVSGQPVQPNADGEVEGVLALPKPWPGMARTLLGDHARYLATYFKPYPGYYFTGDSVFRDKDGYHFITGRVDDVINISGHRIGTAEVESSLVLHPAVAQAAVVAKPHSIKGQAIVCFVMLDQHFEDSAEDKEHKALVKDLIKQVRSEIGPFAQPDDIYVTPSLPMTRSGKIMRRILRKIVAGETDSLGDISTLADPSIVEAIIKQVAEREEAEAKLEMEAAVAAAAAVAK